MHNHYKKADKAGGQWSCTLPYNLYGNHAVMWAVMIKIRIQLQFAENWMYRDHTVHTNQGHWLTTHTTQAVISCCVLYTLYNTVCVHRGMEEQSNCVCVCVRACERVHVCCVCGVCVYSYPVMCPCCTLDHRPSSPLLLPLDLPLQVRIPSDQSVAT